MRFSSPPCFVIAMDSFKGSLSSPEAASAVKDAALRVFPDAEVRVCPVADGGEGTAHALTLGLGGTLVRVPVTGPLGEPVEAEYGILPDHTAVIEIAAAAGLTLVPEENQNVLSATTFGVGELIRDAVERGCREFLIGLGGSATNDGGTGMLSSLGFRFENAAGDPIAPGAAGLCDLAVIRTEGALPALRECRFSVACDVTNPLCGKRGCSAVFAPQKGAASEMIAPMDASLARYADLCRALFPTADPDAPGAGAAGGLGYAFCTFLGARLQSGIALVLEKTGFEAALDGADLVLTGEGRLDAQTAMGKAPVGVARLARTRGIPVIAFAGCLGAGAEACREEGICAYFPIVRGAMTLAEAMAPETARENLTGTAEEVFRALKL